MNLDGLLYPMDRSPSLPRKKRYSVVCDLMQTGPCSETDDAGIATVKPPLLGLPSARVHVVALVVVVVVVVVVDPEGLAVR
jgi:hypothetical protein